MSHVTDQPDTGRKLTGRHVLAIFVIGFGLIFAVNFFMAYRAVSTFPGMEVSSSYADSQSFDLRRDAQEALGWQASVITPGDGTFVLHLLDRDGALVAPAELTALLTRPTNQREDQTLVLRRENGAFVAPVALSDGQWRLRLTGVARDGTEYRHNITFRYAE